MIFSFFVSYFNMKPNASYGNSLLQSNKLFLCELHRILLITIFSKILHVFSILLIEQTNNSTCFHYNSEILENSRVATEDNDAVHFYSNNSAFQLNILNCVFEINRNLLRLYLSINGPFFFTYIFRLLVVIPYML